MRYAKRIKINKENREAPRNAQNAVSQKRRVRLYTRKIKGNAVAVAGNEGKKEFRE